MFLCRSMCAFHYKMTGRSLLCADFLLLQSSIQLGLIFFSWCSESPWVSIMMPARNIFLSFQNLIIKCRALFAWVMVPNDFPYWKEKNYDGKNAWRSEREDKVFSFKQLSKAWGWHRERSAACFSCTWEVPVLIVSHFSCFLKWREQRCCTARHK